VRSIGLLGRCLEALKEDAEAIKTIVDPFREVQSLRSKIAAHATDAEPPDDPKAQYRDLLALSDAAMRGLAGLIAAGKFDIQTGDATPSSGISGDNETEDDAAH